MKSPRAGVSGHVRRGELGHGGASSEDQILVFHFKEPTTYTKNKTLKNCTRPTAQKPPPDTPAPTSRVRRLLL